MAVLNIDAYITANKRILSIVGLYPVSYIRYYSCVFFLLLIIIPEVFQIYFNRHDLSAVLETSSVLLTIILAILKSIVWLTQGKTTRLIDFLVVDFWEIAVNSNNTVIHKYAKSAKRVTDGYTFLIFNALLVFYTLPLVNIVRTNFTDNHNESSIDFPFVANYPVFCYKSPYYEIVYLTQILGTSVCGMIILGMDTLIATAIFHTCGHFNALAEDFYNLPFVNDLVLSKKLARLIEHHQIIIRFSESMEQIFSPMMLLQVLASSVIICLVGFQVNSTLARGGELVTYFSYLMMALFQLLLFCWPGDQLIHQSLMVSDAVYFSSWYQASKEERANFSFIILRAQKPCFLSAGKFSSMGLENFCAILSTSMSYFMLLRNLET